MKQRTFLALAIAAFASASAVIALAAAPAVADPTIALLPQTVGQRAHYRVVRTIQGTNGPESTTAVFELVRREPATLTIARADVGVPSVSVLKTGPTGALTLAEDGGVTAGVSLGDAIYAFNAATAAMQGATGSAHDSWASYVPIAPAAGAPTAGITFVPANVAGTELDFYGTGQASATAASPAPERRSRGSGGRGGFGGGGFGRGGRGGDAGEAEAPAFAGGIATVVHVDGHISGKHVTRIAITETRTITVASMPFTNVASWSITVVK